MPSGKKAPFVAVRTDIRKEERVLVIAEIAGYNRHEAIGRLVDMWAWCTDRRLEDAPDDCEGYAVSEAIVCRFLGPLGVRAILGDSCDELALGELRADGLIYLRGTADTVQRLRAQQKSASAGGKARVVTGTRSAGVFVTGDTKHMSDMCGEESPDVAHADVSEKTITPAGHQPATSRPPAGHQPEPARSHKPQAIEELSLAPSAKRPATGHQQVVADFDRRFHERYGQKPTWGKKQGGMVKSLLASHPAEEITRRIGILFTRPPPWITGVLDLGTLVQHFDKLTEPHGAQKANVHRRLASNSTDDEPDLSSYPKVT